MPWTQQTFSWGLSIANGSKNNQLLPTTTVKTLVPCSSASAWVLLWVVSRSVHCTVHAHGMIELFLFYSPHVTRVAPGSFRRECAHAHESCPHMFVSMYVCGQHANCMYALVACMHWGWSGQEMCSLYLGLITVLTPYPCFEIHCVSLLCVN